MDRRALNSAEWENPANWIGPRWISLYSSRQDTRLWVPKQIPSLGWTINFGHKRGKVCLVAVILGAIAFIALSNAFVLNFINR